MRSLQFALVAVGVLCAVSLANGQYGAVKKDSYEPPKDEYKPDLKKPGQEDVLYVKGQPVEGGKPEEPIDEYGGVGEKKDGGYGKEKKYDEPKKKYDEPKYEEPKEEEPKKKYDEPKYEEPKKKYDEPKYEEPKYEKKYEEPKYEKKYEEPKYEKKYEEPKYEKKYEEPKYEKKYEEPKYEKKYEEPKYEKKYEEPKYEEPKYEKKYEEPKYEKKYEEPKYEKKYEEPKYEKKYEEPKYEKKYEEPKYEKKYEDSYGPPKGEEGKHQIVVEEVPLNPEGAGDEHVHGFVGGYLPESPKGGYGPVQPNPKESYGGWGPKEGGDKYGEAPKAGYGGTPKGGYGDGKIYEPFPKGAYGDKKYEQPEIKNGYGGGKPQEGGYAGGAYGGDKKGYGEEKKYDSEPEYAPKPEKTITTITTLSTKACNKMVDGLLEKLQTSFTGHMNKYKVDKFFSPVKIGSWARVRLYDGQFDKIGKLCRGGDFQVLPQGENIIIRGVVTVPEPRAKFGGDAYLYNRLKVRNSNLKFCAKDASFRMQMIINKRIKKVEVDDLEPVNVHGFHVEDDHGSRSEELAWPFNKIREPQINKQKYQFMSTLQHKLCDDFRQIIHKPEIKEEILRLV